MGAGAGRDIRKGQRGVTMEKPGLTGRSLSLYQSVGDRAGDREEAGGIWGQLEEANFCLGSQGNMR